jgi:hypothetical protein
MTKFRVSVHPNRLFIVSDYAARDDDYTIDWALKGSKIINNTSEYNRIMYNILTNSNKRG